MPATPGALFCRNKGATKITNENITKDNQLIYCEWYNTPLVDPKGSVSGIVSLVQDSY